MSPHKASLKSVTQKVCRRGLSQSLVHISTEQGLRAPKLSTLIVIIEMPARDLILFTRRLGVQ